MAVTRCLKCGWGIPSVFNYCPAGEEGESCEEASGLSVKTGTVPDLVVAVIGATWETIARSAYKAYAASTGNKNFRGEPMPEFDALPDAIQTAWQAAVRQAVDVSQGGSFGLDIEQRWEGWKRP